MIAIRAPHPEDIAPLTEALNQPGVRLGTIRLPFTGEEFLRRHLLEPGEGVHPVVATWDGVAVGQGTLMLGHGRQRHTGEIFLFVHDAYWGKGIGSAILAALLDLADNWYGLIRLGLGAAPGNAAALHLYEKAGFVREGLKRADVITEGRLEDSVIMGRVRPAPVSGSVPLQKGSGQ